MSDSDIATLEKDLRERLEKKTSTELSSRIEELDKIDTRKVTDVQITEAILIMDILQLRNQKAGPPRKKKTSAPPPDPTKLLGL